MTEEERPKIEFDRFVEMMESWHERFVELINDEGRMQFCLRLRVKSLTYPKEGTGYGDTPYCPWEKVRP